MVVPAGHDQADAIGSRNRLRLERLLCGKAISQVGGHFPPKKSGNEEAKVATVVGKMLGQLGFA